jgi:hypothetical protein
MHGSDDSAMPTDDIGAAAIEHRISASPASSSRTMSVCAIYNIGEAIGSTLAPAVPTTAYSLAVVTDGGPPGNNDARFSMPSVKARESRCQGRQAIFDQAPLAPLRAVAPRMALARRKDP